MAKLSSLFRSGFLPNSLSVEVDANPTLVNTAEERILTLDEVSWHDTPGDCWIIVYDRVYDITDFLAEHPGGSDILLEYAGRDATIAFRGTGHSAQAIRALDRFLVGELPMHQRIFRKPGGFNLSDLPE